MAPRTPIRHVEDSASLRAIAHPLRLHLLGHLRTYGPATASALGRSLGETSGSTSYHLRQLQRFGFIEPDPVQPSRREKVWRAVHQSTNFTMWDGAGPADQAALDTVVSVQVEHLLEGVRRRQRAAAEQSAAWRAAHLSDDHLIRVTPTALVALKERIWELLQDVGSPEGPQARMVELHLQSFFSPDQPPEGPS